jgi:hypothetical protein
MSSHKRHYGKAMVTYDAMAKEITIVMDCAVCSRFELKIPIEHMRSVAKTIDLVADTMHLESESTNVHEIIDPPYHANSLGDLEHIKQRYESIPLEDALRLSKEAGKKVSDWE